MRILIATIILLVFNACLLSQGELVNTFSYYSEVYGGTEDSGISRTESFVFVASRTVAVKGIPYKGEVITLQKGDSLVVNVHSHRPYATYPVDTTRVDRQDDIKQPAVKDRFRVMKDGRIYYANVQWPYEWPGTIEYVYKKKNYTAVKKEGFDTGYTGYAP